MLLMGRICLSEGGFGEASDLLAQHHGLCLWTSVSLFGVGRARELMQYDRATAITGEGRLKKQ